MVKLTINGKPVEVEEGTLVIDAAKKLNIKIPSLCYSKDLTPWGACGLCVIKNVAPNGRARMARACTTTCENNMNIITNDAELFEVRRTVVELILSNHPNDCLQCPRNGCCELQTVAAEFGIRETPFSKVLSPLPIDDSNPAIIYNPSKCIRCGRCVKVCQDVQNVWAIEFQGRGIKGSIAPAAGVKLGDSPCIKCGQCAAHCPVGALYERDQTQPVFRALMDPETVTAVQFAPAVRVALAEEFGLPPGEIYTKKIYAALRALGFDAVFDTNFSADLTIMEEGTELVKRLTTKGSDIPLITSCCPAWVDYMEKYYADFIPNFSTAKSPQQMMGAMIKAYWAPNATVNGKKVNPDKVCSVSIMQCTAKKWESHRDDKMKSAGHGWDVDIVLTTRELARMIKQAGIDIVNLPDGEADSILGTYAGAGTLFGATGGVMEAAVRSAYYLVTHKEMKPVEFMPARGLKDIKEAEVDLDGTKIKIAVAHQMGNIEQVLNKIRECRKAGQPSPWQFIEVMACRGGCVAGGGQPYGATDEIRKERAAGLYKDDEKSAVRCSHQNSEVTKAYKDFLGEPNGHKAHELLHTEYKKLEAYAL
jgi:NADH-quinone oxidoreductase subunit G